VMWRSRPAAIRTPFDSPSSVSRPKAAITVDQAYARYNAECLVRFGKPLRRRRAMGATTC
jgi:hypothetical protein